MSTQGSAAQLNVQQLIQNAQLSALPQSAIQILELSKDPNNGPADFAGPIEADPGLAGQVLRFVNSSYFGFSREISSVKLAITLVGIRTIKNFTLWSAIFSLMPNPQCGPFDLKSLWQDSLRRGLFARRFAKLLGVKDGEEAFMAALLQDMAVPLLAKELPNDYQEMLELRKDGNARLSDLERERYATTHAAIGAALANHWHLPQSLVDMILKHLDCQGVLSGDASAEEQAVTLSALLPAGVDEGWHERSDFEAYYQSLAPAGGPPAVELLGEIDDQFAEFAPMFKMTVPARSLAELFVENEG